MAETHPESLREIYKKTFGKYPNGNAKRETLLRMLKNEGVEYKEEDSQGTSDEKEVATPTKEEVIEKVKETQEKIPVKQPEIKEGEVPESEGMPVHQGVGSKRQYLLFFRGQPRYWTHATIMAMKSAKDDIRFPENTTYENMAKFEKCKTC